MVKGASEPNYGQLRGQAEQALARPSRHAVTDETDALRLLRELQVHQIEREMQNEALRQSQAEVQEAVQRYADLNDRLETIVATRTADLIAATQVAESASRAKSNFLSHMSHEMRTPMTAIVGFAEVLQKQISDSWQRELADEVLDASHHLMQIINDMLDITRIEAGKLALENIDFDLGKTLAEIRVIVGTSAAAKGLAFSITIEAGVATGLHGDPRRLSQILINFLNNSIKFTARGAVSLTVRAGHGDSRDAMLRFEVTDTGMGIDPAVQASLFAPFAQADESLNREHGGLGLGLAISRQLAQLLGGEVGCDSAPGKGSTFWLTTPLRPASGQVSAASGFDAMRCQAWALMHTAAG